MTKCMCGSRITAKLPMEFFLVNILLPLIKKTKIRSSLFCCAVLLVLLRTLDIKLSNYFAPIKSAPPIIVQFSDVTKYAKKLSNQAFRNSTINFNFSIQKTFNIQAIYPYQGHLFLDSYNYFPSRINFSSDENDKKKLK